MTRPLTLMIALACLIASAVPSSALEPNSYTLNPDSTRQYLFEECLMWTEATEVVTDPRQWVQPYGGLGSSNTGVKEYFPHPESPYFMVQATGCPTVVAILECINEILQPFEECVDEELLTPGADWSLSTGEYPQVSIYSEALPVELSDISRGDPIYVHGFPSLRNHMPLDLR